MVSLIISCMIIIVTVQCVLAVVIIAILEPKKESLQFTVKDDLSDIKSFGVTITETPIEKVKNAK